MRDDSCIDHRGSIPSRKTPVMIQKNPRDEQSAPQSDPIDMWCWLRLLGWRSPLFEGPESEEAAPKETASELPAPPCRIGHEAPPKDSSSLPPELPVERERELGWAIVNEHCAGAKELLFFHNLPLLARVVDKYEGRGLTTAELIEHGAKGLREAVNDFDPAPGVRFSTIATWWIKQSFKQALKDRRAAHAIT